LKKVILITGSSSNLGTQLAKKYIDEKCVTYGIAKDTQNLPGLHYVPCDITNFDNCKVVVEKIIREEGQIDILINNASVNLNISPVEYYTKKEIREFFDVNLLGTINIIKAVLPYMREKRKGKIVNISSVYSPMGIPYQTLFAANKAAIDSLSSGLRMELKDFGISVITAHAKMINFHENGNFMVKEEDDYFTTYKHVHKLMIAENKKQVNPKRIARAIYNATKKGHPPAKIYVGVKNSMSRIFLSLIPRKVREKYVRNKYFKNRDNEEKIKKTIEEINTKNKGEVKDMTDK